MNIGDKVRSLAGNEEGVVVRFLEAKQVEVEIEDGFRIPFVMSELVVVSSVEVEVFGERETASSIEEVSTKTKQKALASKGIYLAFTHRNDRELDVNLINNTDLELLYTFGEEESRNYKGVVSGRLNKRNYNKLTIMNLDKFERWPFLIVQLLFFKVGTQAFKEPLIRKLRFKANTFHKSVSEAPLLEQESYLFQIDDELKAIDPKELLDKIADNSVPKSPERKVVIEEKKRKRIPKEVDLHADKVLGKDYKRINKDEILIHQLNAFEEGLDQAIYASLDEITFIHGVGNGVLKNEIHKRLSKNSNVDYYKDARKEKFGYGATLVKIK